MFIKNCGFDTQHEIGAYGEAGRPSIRPHYFISRFSTPFAYKIDDECFFGNAGDFLFMPANNYIYHGPASKDETYVNDWLYVSGNDFDELIKKYPFPEKKAIHIEDNGMFNNCIRKIKKEFLLKPLGCEDIMAAYVTEAIVSLYRSYQRKHLQNSSFTRIESVREKILLNPEKKWSLEEMANLSGYSISRFSSLYTQHFGLSPKADLIQSRVRLAKELLNYTEQSVTEVAAQCGFQSIYYFSKYFKATVGITPSEYAKRWQ